MSARRLSPAVAILLALAAAGCAGKKPHAAAPAPPTAGSEKTTHAKPGEAEPPTVAPGGGQARAGYDRRVEPLVGIDTSPLRGRKLALDPGHGGRFPGSVGVKGLTEAEVNLGVALHLWGLLTDAGAQVLMTRTADKDFTTAADSSLRADLAARTAKANAFDPDVFLSIHHNADAGARHDLNETQTYYKFTDPEASYDLGQALHKHLVLNLGVGADRLLPGNYFVVRNAVGAAALGESSYLTNPDVEARLALGAKQRLEAEAYFLGLLDYFRQGVPRITATRIDPIATVSDPPDGAERPWIVAVTDRAPGTARLLLDGAPVDSARIERLPAAGGAWTLRTRPASPLTDGWHRVEWAVRAAGGNWSKARRDSFQVELPLAKTVLEIAPAGGGLAAGQIAGLTLRALDRHGRALADTLSAHFTARVGAVMVDSSTTVVVPGEARAYARVTGGSAADFAATLQRPRPRADLAEATAHITLAAPGARAHAVSGYARTADGHPIAGARVTGAAGDTAFAMTNANGFFALSAVPDSARPIAAAPGYVTLVPTGAAPPAGPAAQLWLAPIAGGALIGRRIALDAAGGGADTTGMFASPGLEPTTPSAPGDSSAFDSSLTAAPAGVAKGDTLAARRAQVIGADANLRVARALKEYLEAAGAQVVMTRDRPDSLTAIDRLRVTEAFGAERLISIAHRAAPRSASAGHYFASPNGTALAQRIGARLDGRGLTKGARVVVSPAYLVQQTAAIAVEVNLPDARPLYVEPTRGAARLRDEAYALYLALLEDLGGAPAAFVSLPVTVTRGAAPAPGVPVVLDGRWTLFTGADGKAMFEGLPAGAVLSVVAGTAAARATLPAPAAGVTIALPADAR